MSRALLAAAAGALLASSALPVQASARIEGLSLARPAAAGSPATLVVSMKRATPLDLAPCDLLIDTGDGEKPLQVRFSPADPQRKNVGYTFKKAGTYKVTVKGTGGSACEGERAVEVLVAGAGSATAAAKPATSAGCPAGWSQVSREGRKFTCRADPPPSPIQCDPGTKYFSANGQIGCR